VPGPVFAARSLLPEPVRLCGVTSGSRSRRGVTASHSGDTRSLTRLFGHRRVGSPSSA
jgi:hypothetical protein